MKMPVAILFEKNNEGPDPYSQRALCIFRRNNYSKRHHKDIMLFSGQRRKEELA